MTGEIIDDKAMLALKEICERCGLSEETVRAYVEEGVIEAAGDDVARWRFSEISVVRVQKAYRLERDLGLNPAGAALALDLMAQIEDLQTRVRLLQREEG